MGPIDYLGMMPQRDFLKDIQGGLQLGQAIQAMGDQREARQKAELAQQQYLADVQAAMRDPKPEAFAALTVKYPAQREAFAAGWKTLNEAQQKDEQSLATQVYASLNAGRPDIAKGVLEKRITALKNSGKPADDYMYWLDMVTNTPDQARGYAGLILSNSMGADKFSSMFSTLGTERRADELQPDKVSQARSETTIKGVEAANAATATALKNADVRSQIDERAQRLNLDRDKLQSEYEMKLYELNQRSNTLGDDAKKIVNDASLQAVAADQAAGQMLDLADRLEKAGGGYGNFSGSWEWVKRTTGSQDAVSQMRQEYTRIRNSQAIKMLPPGPATDKDIEMALKGFPDDTADAKTVSAFLRGMAKLQQMDAAANAARAEWVNSVGSLARPKTDIEVDGIKVPAGTTYIDFTRQFLNRRVERRAAEQAVQQVQGRGYMRFAQPQGSQPNTGGATADY